MRIQFWTSVDRPYMLSLAKVRHNLSIPIEANYGVLLTEDYDSHGCY